MEEAIGGKTKEKTEGNDLLGSPTFVELENGRFKCVETGHEVLDGDKESYSRNKRCRVGLIDYALSHQKPPLNMFKQDPLCRSKLICKLTGDNVNKNEQHIWKHVNGKRFLNKLEQKEREKKPAVKQSETVVKKKDKKEKGIHEVISETRDNDSNSEEADFWVPPVRERWDFGNGSDRWDPDSESEQESAHENTMVDDDGAEDSEELSARTKRMSIEIGPSSFASRKKKSRKNTRPS